MDIKTDHLNFAVGPVMMSDSIRQMGKDRIPYFRTTDFSQLMLENERILKDLMGAPQSARAVFLTGSGTAAMDAAVNNLFTVEDKLIVINGGSFGHRFCEIAEAYGIPYQAVHLECGKALKREHLEPLEIGRAHV